MSDSDQQVTMTDQQRATVTSEWERQTNNKKQWPANENDRPTTTNSDQRVTMTDQQRATVTSEWEGQTNNKQQWPANENDRLTTTNSDQRGTMTDQQRATVTSRWQWQTNNKQQWPASDNDRPTTSNSDQRMTMTDQQRVTLTSGWQAIKTAQATTTINRQTSNWQPATATNVKDSDLQEQWSAPNDKPVTSWSTERPTRAKCNNAQLQTQRLTVISSNSEKQWTSATSDKHATVNSNSNHVQRHPCTAQ